MWSIRSAPPTSVDAQSRRRRSWRGRLSAALAVVLLALGLGAVTGGPASATSSFPILPFKIVGIGGNCMGLDPVTGAIQQETCSLLGLDQLWRYDTLNYQVVNVAQGGCLAWDSGTGSVVGEACGTGGNENWGFDPFSQTQGFIYAGTSTSPGTYDRILAANSSGSYSVGPLLSPPTRNLFYFSLL